jgi:hypothetical protein
MKCYLGDERGLYVMIGDLETRDKANIPHKLRFL